jgi:hypothetical protein
MPVAALVVSTIVSDMAGSSHTTPGEADPALAAVASGGGHALWPSGVRGACHGGGALVFSGAQPPRSSAE